MVVLMLGAVPFAAVAQQGAPSAFPISLAKTARPENNRSPQAPSQKVGPDDLEPLTTDDNGGLLKRKIGGIASFSSKSNFCLSSSK